MDSKKQVNKLYNKDFIPKMLTFYGVFSLLAPRKNDYVNGQTWSSNQTMHEVGLDESWYAF